MDASTASALEQLCVARQPILDENNQVFGYELLSRASDDATSWTGPVDQASARMIDDAMLSVGLETLTGGKLAFLNVAHEVLLSGATSLLTPQAVVLELLESVPATAATLEACRTLKQRGFAIALDDFIPGSDAEAFVPYAKYVKLDLLATTKPELAAAGQRLRKAGLRIIGEKVETTDAHAQARAAGCTLFQGYFFCRPQTFAVRAMSTRQITQMRLISALNQASVSIGTVEELLKQDPRLSYRVLRCVNSAAFAMRREVHSIREALLFLGLQQIRNWASVWSLAGMNGGSPELVTMTILRARCCELLGAELDAPNAGAEYFLLGLCSLLDVILQRPFETALEGLPLASDTRDALLGKANAARSVLDAVIHYERGEWDEAEAAAAKVGLDGAQLRGAYHGAFAWARQVSSADNGA